MFIKYSTFLFIITIIIYLFFGKNIVVWEIY